MAHYVVTAVRINDDDEIELFMWGKAEVLLFLVETLMLGGGLGGLLFGAWMVMANILWGLHSEVAALIEPPIIVNHLFQRRA